MPRIPSRFTGIVSLLMLGTVLLVSFPASLLECDAVIYSCAGLARDMIQSTDAGHLVWGFLEILAADLGRAADPAVNPIDYLRWLSVLAALMTVWVFHRIMHRLGVESRIALVCAGVLLFSYSFWHFSLQAEPHLPSLAFMAGFLYVAVAFYRAPSSGMAALAALWLGLATLFHQTSILLAPAFLLPQMIWPHRPTTWTRHIPAFVGTYFLAAIVPYLLVGWFVRDLQTVPEFKAWLMGVSTWGSWGGWTWTTPIKSVVGILRSLLGSHFMLGIDPVMSMATNVFPAASWDDELLVAQRVPDWLRFVLLFLEVGVLVVVIRVAVGLPRRIMRIWHDRRDVVAFLLVWLGLYGGFIMWWAPERAEFWIPVILPALVIVGLSFGHDARPTGRAGNVGIVFLLGLLVVNFGGSIWPQSRPDIEPETTVMVAINTVTGPGDYVLSSVGFRGRAAKYIYSVHKVDLLAPRLYPASLESPGAEGGGGPVHAGPNRLRGLSSVAAVDSVMTWAGREGNRVFLVRTPFMTDDISSRAFLRIVDGIEGRFQFGRPVSLPADQVLVELRRRT